MSEEKYKLCPCCGEKMYATSGGWQCTTCGVFESGDGKLYNSYPIPAIEHDFDWKAFRANAAKDLIPFAARMKDYRGYPCDIVMEAILLADELIRRLKDE